MIAGKLKLILASRPTWRCLKDAEVSFNFPCPKGRKIIIYFCEFWPEDNIHKTQRSGLIDFFFNVDRRFNLFFFEGKKSLSNTLCWVESQSIFLSLKQKIFIGKNVVLKLPNGSGWKFVSSLNKLNLVLNRSLNTNKQPVRNEHIHLTGKTKELITIIKWSLKKY